jgi:hypothetical protein
MINQKPASSLRRTKAPASCSPFVLTSSSAPLIAASSVPNALAQTNIYWAPAATQWISTFVKVVVYLTDFRERAAFDIFGIVPPVCRAQIHSTIH